MDELELSAGEAELAQVRGKLRDLRQEMMRMEEARLVGQPIDEKEYGEIKAEVDRLNRRQHEINDQLTGGGNEYEKRGFMAPVLDFIVDYKIVISCVAFIVTVAAIMIWLADRRMSEEEAKKIREALGVGSSSAAAAQVQEIQRQQLLMMEQRDREMKKMMRAAEGGR